MANEEHLAILKQGVEAWNAWREKAREIDPDLSEADLHRADLRGADFACAVLWGANLSGADLRGADLFLTNLERADLTEARLEGATLDQANLTEANLTRAHLEGADLTEAIFVKTILEDANLAGCRVFGISAWGVTLKGATQSDLVITPPGESAITVDNLEVAQFIYLLLNNQKIRQVIETITSKVVLILGRFIPERKAVLDALREELRKRDYLPVVFDFDPSASRDLTETVSTLAHMSRFIIADISDPKSIPQELQAIVPNLPSVAIQPIMVHGQQEYGLFEHFRRYPWVLPVYEYKDIPQLLTSLTEQVILPVEAAVNKLQSSPGS